MELLDEFGNTEAVENTGKESNKYDPVSVQYEWQ
jgi:hypothetical protein